MGQIQGLLQLVGHGHIILVAMQPSRMSQLKCDNTPAKAMLTLMFTNAAEPRLLESS